MPRTRERGSWVIEIAVAVVVLGLLVGIVGPTETGAPHASRHDIVRVQFTCITRALDAHRRITGRLPDTLLALTQPILMNDVPLLREIPRDPWGNEYAYRVRGQQIELRSGGDDGQLGTDDDIVHESIAAGS